MLLIVDGGLEFTLQVIASFSSIQKFTCNTLALSFKTLLLYRRRAIKHYFDEHKLQESCLPLISHRYSLACSPIPKQYPLI